MTKQHDEITKRFLEWKKKATEDAGLSYELNHMREAETEDAFYRDLSFGTGGLRGVIGAGTNRMNIYTVARASRGLSAYLKSEFRFPSVVVGYDSRIKSGLFAKTAAGIFAAMGIQVYFWPELLPVPTVSYAVRELHASAGVMITASHNPAEYNGYKVYSADGCQITDAAAAAILAEIEKSDYFPAVPGAFEAQKNSGAIREIGPEVLTAYLEAVKNQSVLFGDPIDRDVAIVYSPLNGAGLKPVMQALAGSGFGNITVVREQEQPDGNFPTCPYPNPEIREAMALGLEYCRRTGAELLLATDPDCDRCGIAVRDGDDYRLLSGNEAGLLLLDYICAQRTKHGKMPEDPVFIKTIVTMDLAERIAARYGVRTVNVLTGFKYIGEQIGLLEAKGKADSFICGFEESYGYLTGSYVRDKDAVNAAFLICEMFAFYKTRGVTLPQKLEELWQTYGYCLNTLHSYQFEGSAGMAHIGDTMRNLRRGLTWLGTREVRNTVDYSSGIGHLPKADVLRFSLSGDCSVIVRPSGTEPKLKAYLSVCAETETEAGAAEAELHTALDRLLC